jgi:hypothetical protein
MHPSPQVRFGNFGMGRGPWVGFQIITAVRVMLVRRVIRLILVDRFICYLILLF